MSHGRVTRVEPGFYVDPVDGLILVDPSEWLRAHGQPDVPRLRELVAIAAARLAERRGCRTLVLHTPVEPALWES